MRVRDIMTRPVFTVRPIDPVEGAAALLADRAITAVPVFGIFMLIFETITAALILSRGRLVKWGLFAAIVFLVGVTPLGLEEVPNLVLAAGVAFLLTQGFPTDVWTMLRRHRRRPRFPTAERETSAPRARGHAAGVKAR